MKKINKCLLVGIIIGLLGLFGCGGEDVTPENISTVEKITTDKSTVSESTGVFRRFWSDPPTLDPHLTSDTSHLLTDTTSLSAFVDCFAQRHARKAQGVKELLDRRRG